MFSRSDPRDAKCPLGDVWMTPLHGPRQHKATLRKSAANQQHGNWCFYIPAGLAECWAGVLGSRNVCAHTKAPIPSSPYTNTPSTPLQLPPSLWSVVWLWFFFQTHTHCSLSVSHSISRYSIWWEHVCALVRRIIITQSVFPHIFCCAYTQTRNAHEKNGCGLCVMCVFILFIRHRRGVCDADIDDACTHIFHFIHTPHTHRWRRRDGETHTTAHTLAEVFCIYIYVYIYCMCIYILHIMLVPK